MEEPTRRGMRAAWILFGCATGVHVALVSTSVAIHRPRTPPRDALSPFADLYFPLIWMLYSVPLLAIATGIAALVVGARLPQESRKAFWLTGLLCVFLSVALWGATCGMGPALFS